MKICHKLDGNLARGTNVCLGKQIILYCKESGKDSRIKQELSFMFLERIKGLTEINEEPSKALPLVLRHDHYTGDIVFLLAKLFLREGEKDQVCQSCTEAGNLLHLPLSLSKAHTHTHTPFKIHLAFKRTNIVKTLTLH